jgi:Ser/Thr protein kinase RdoA (MazF antagonist)
MCGSVAEFGWPGGDQPGPLEFNHEPPPPVAEAIKGALAPFFPRVMEPGAYLRALQRVTGPVGRYRLATSKGSWFVRVTLRRRDPPLERALTAYLASRGVSINPLLVAGANLEWNGRALRVDVRPMIFGRNFDGSAADLQSVASTLAACHRALRSWPRADAVRKAARNRAERLAAIRDRIAGALKDDAFDAFVPHASWTAAYGSWAAAHRDWLAEMIADFDPYHDRWSGAQCLHGQIHRGNVLFRSDDGAAVLVDFEESVHVFAPVAWDVAHLVQRFCLHDAPSIPVARHRHSIIAKAYGVAVPGLTEMMRQAAWFSIAAILERHVSRRIVTPLEEYKKFVDLERQARSYESAL